MNDMKKPVMKDQEEKAFGAETTANAKALKQNECGPLWKRKKARLGTWDGMSSE